VPFTPGQVRSAVFFGGGGVSPGFPVGAVSNLQIYNARVTPYNVPNDGSPAKALIQAIIDAIAGAKATIYFPPGAYGLEADLTFPSNIRLWMEKGARFTATVAGRTLTINGDIDFSLDRVFDQSVNAFALVFGKGSTPALSPEWWGAIGDGATDNTTPFQQMLDSANGSAVKHCRLAAAVYLTGMLTMPGNGIVIEGVGSSYGYASPTSSSILKAKAGAGAHLINLVVTGTAVDRSYCQLRNFEIDGQTNVQNGINVSSQNIIDGVTCRNCTNAGILLANFTNQTLIDRCYLSENSGWGVRIVGPSATIFSIRRSNIRVNTLGGILAEGGAMMDVVDCVIESNFGPGVRIYRPNTGIGAFCDIFTFQSSWIENNGRTSLWSIEVDSQTRDYGTGPPTRIRFVDCIVDAGAAAQKYMTVQSVRYLTFENCIFGTSTAADAVTLGAFASNVAFVETTGITAAQMAAALATGKRCYSSDRETRLAPAYTNGWVDFGGGYAGVKYWADDQGVVHIEGMMKSGAIGLSAFTLAQGYRPATTRRFPVSSNNAFGQVDIGADGTVKPDAGNNTSFVLEGIAFRTD